MTDWIAFIKDVGFPIALVLYFIIRDREREKRSNIKEDSTQAAFKELNDKQFTLTEKAIEAVSASNEIKRELVASQREMTESHRDLKSFFEKFSERRETPR